MDESDTFEPWEPVRYPWERWLAKQGQRTVLLDGVDYGEGKTSSIRSGIYQAAARRAQVVRTIVTHDKDGHPDGIIINPRRNDYEESRAKGPGRPEAYPYGEWFAWPGGEYYLQPSDYAGSVGAMKKRIVDAARRRHTKVKVESNKYRAIKIWSCLDCVAAGLRWCDSHAK